MIRDIDYIKPEDDHPINTTHIRIDIDETDLDFLEEARSLSSANFGKGRFSVILYDGQSKEEFQRICNFLEEFDHGKRPLILEPYYWIINLRKEVSFNSRIDSDIRYLIQMDCFSYQ